jgi:TetR/AcrR family transcriptional repressor of mexJK operon
LEKPDATPLPVSPRAQAKREQIRSAAQRLFLTRGFAGTNTDAIAAEAEVSKQTLYVYYKSKEELLEEVLREFIHGLSSGKLEAPVALSDRADLRVRLVTLAHTLIDSIMQPDYLAMVRVVFAEISRFPQIGRLFTSAVPRRVLDAVTALLQQAHTQGLLRVETPDVAARLFVGPLLTYAILDGLLVASPRPPAPAQIEQIVDLFLRACAPDSALNEPQEKGKQL